MPRHRCQVQLLPQPTSCRCHHLCRQATTTTISKQQQPTPSNSYYRRRLSRQEAVGTTSAAKQQPPPPPISSSPPRRTAVVAVSAAKHQPPPPPAPSNSRRHLQAVVAHRSVKPLLPPPKTDLAAVAPQISPRPPFNLVLVIHCTSRASQDDKTAQKENNGKNLRVKTLGSSSDLIGTRPALSRWKHIHSLACLTMSILRTILPRIAKPNGCRCFATGFPSETTAELNKEMESIFGESPSPSPLGSTPQQPARSTNGFGDRQPVLTHIDSSGQAKMVDVSSKHDSTRVAIATCKVLLGQKAFELVASNQIAKGDVLTVAKIAGITGAKQTSNLIPMCHNINLSHVRVDLTLNEEDSSVMIEGEASTSGKTGVEMEAMTAVAIAGLTIYDMCKAASKDICIKDICLQRKSGGKSGSWSRS
ncbi:hypothetical protein GUJ93_ZPchr0014g47554 [Zizania palustris]|uniref:Molybdopterin cofactor biosynthesis C (MoaC) domain-containing protein n=1 Tax=Zizania palustris TaxID=103762 RepID=A0A8J5TET1_ZIZPA|nr:hypothetical protein GUJ93_ZPchr0014g47554 [Zizania palustris]